MSISVDTTASAASAAIGPRPNALSIDRIAVMRFFWWAAATVLGLGILHLILARFLGWRFAIQFLRFLDLNEEMSLPAWYSSGLLLAAAGLLAVHAWLETGHDARMARYWGVLFCIFVYLSLDEQASLHELMMMPLNHLHLTGLLRYSWLVFAAPLLVIGGLYFIPFLLSLPRPIGWRIFLAGCVYVGGAFGMEAIGGYVITVYGHAWAWPPMLLEEGGEIVGATLFISALLRSLEGIWPGAVRVTFATPHR